MNDLKFYREPELTPFRLGPTSYQPLPTPLTNCCLDRFEHRIDAPLHKQLFDWRARYHALNQKMASLKDTPIDKEQKALIMLEKRKLDDHFKLLSIMIENIEKSAQTITNNIR